jgi:spore germination protein YaaH
MVDHTYTNLLSSPDNKVNNTARRFMGGSQEIRRIFNQYQKRWCEKRKHVLHISNYENFRNETSSLFDLVLARIQDETEHLYPLIRETRGDSQRAA